MIDLNIFILKRKPIHNYSTKMAKKLKFCRLVGNILVYYNQADEGEMTHVHFETRKKLYVFGLLRIELPDGRHSRRTWVPISGDETLSPAWGFGTLSEQFANDVL